jgi:hypothetical protein
MLSWANVVLIAGILVTFAVIIVRGNASPRLFLYSLLLVVPLINIWLLRVRSFQPVTFWPTLGLFSWSMFAIALGVGGLGSTLEKGNGRVLLIMLAGTYFAVTIASGIATWPAKSSGVPRDTSDRDTA